MKKEIRYIGNQVVVKSTIVLVSKNDKAGRVYMRKDVTGLSDEQIEATEREIEKKHAHLLRGRELLVRHS